MNEIDKVTKKSNIKINSCNHHTRKQVDRWIEQSLLLAGDVVTAATCYAVADHGDGYSDQSHEHRVLETQGMSHDNILNEKNVCQNLKSMVLINISKNWYAI
jgi:hypothetical protein